MAFLAHILTFRDVVRHKIDFIFWITIVALFTFWFFFLGFLSGSSAKIIAVQPLSPTAGHSGSSQPETIPLRERNNENVPANNGKEKPLE